MQFDMHVCHDIVIMLWFGHVTSLHAVSLEECFFGSCTQPATHTHTCTHTHINAAMGVYCTLMCLCCFVSHDMHVTPSSLQVVTLPSALEVGLSKCTTLQKLTVRGIPTLSSSVTAALLKAVTVIRSLEEVTLDMCDFGM